MFGFVFQLPKPNKNSKVPPRFHHFLTNFYSTRRTKISTFSVEKIDGLTPVVLTGFLASLYPVRANPPNWIIRSKLRAQSSPLNKDSERDVQAAIVPVPDQREWLAGYVLAGCRDEYRFLPWTVRAFCGDLKGVLSAVGFPIFLLDWVFGSCRLVETLKFIPWCPI